MLARQGPPRSPARQRLLDTATGLFYAQGVHAVGIDRIIAEAGVAKATFYNHFPAKDDLVRAYVEEQSKLQRARADLIPRDDPRAALLTVFDIIVEIACEPGFRGCAFINAAAEYPDAGHPVRLAIADHRHWFRELVRGLLVAEGHRDPDRTADILVLLRDGLAVGGGLDEAADYRDRTRDAVTRVLDA